MEPTVFGVGLKVLIVLVGLGGLLVGFILGLLVGRSSASGPDVREQGTRKQAGPHRFSDDDLRRFGPCPNCRVACNLEEWRCGSCGYTLHEM